MPFVLLMRGATIWIEFLISELSRVARASRSAPALRYQRPGRRRSRRIYRPDLAETARVHARLSRCSPRRESGRLQNRRPSDAALAAISASMVRQSLEELASELDRVEHRVGCDRAG